MTRTANIQPFAPAENEIALLAYLNWEKSGKPTNNAVRFWIEAEAQLRAANAQAAEAAAKAIRQWPPMRNAVTAPVRLKKPARTSRKCAPTPKRTATAKQHKLVAK